MLYTQADRSCVCVWCACGGLASLIPLPLRLRVHATMRLLNGRRMEGDAQDCGTVVYTHSTAPEYLIFTPLAAASKSRHAGGGGAQAAYTMPPAQRLGSPDEQPTMHCYT